MAQANIRPSDIIQTIRQQPKRLLAPVAAVTVLAIVYAIFRPATWEASQALVVREEAGDRLTRPGKFAHLDEMKTTQETILELAKSRNVLAKALEQVGPGPRDTLRGVWPTDEAVDALQDRVKITPPKGAEFGKTEVFYLKVQDRDRQRSVDLAAAICHQLQARYGELRGAKAKSTTDELVQTVSLAREDLNVATSKLSAMEQRFGSDLSELRILNESPSGDSDLRRTALDLEKELRTCRATQSENQELLKLLGEVLGDPNRLLASPSILIKSQPSLGRLKDGLVDAQLRTGALRGTMSEDHPLVQGAREAEAAICAQLHEEIKVAINGVQADIRVNAERLSHLERQFSSVQQRLEGLAGLRAEYANLVAATKNRGELLKTVEQELADARASQAAASVSSLINPVDAPDAGTRPLGPGRAMIGLAGFGGGWLVGLALVLLTVVPNASIVEQPSSIRIGEKATRKPALAMTLKQVLRRAAVDWK